MNLTSEQERIVASSAPVVFVAAAAGSGKTKLLVDRYLRAILQQGVPPALLPTVTFTRKAAGELRQRIRDGLLAAGRTDLAWGLDDAPIGTIHSLCSRLLRSRPLDADVDPSFSVLEEVQADIVAAEAFARAWEELVLESSSEERVLLARHRSCFEDVRVAHSRLRQDGVEHPALPALDVPDPEAARAALLSVLHEVCGDLAGVALGGRAAANLEKAEACDGWLLGARPTWEDLEVSATFTPHLGCGAATKEAFTRVKEALNAFRDALAAEYLSTVFALADSLLRRFHTHYCAEKRRRGALDFADLELGARRLLLAGARPFGEGSLLMVDEFQDTNGLQCEILDGLATDGQLTVGDTYQSIYAFRGADVDVFRSRQAALVAAQGVVERCGERADPPAEKGPLVDTLSTNFRSRAPLLSALNHIFGHEAFFGEGFPALLPSPAPPESPTPLLPAVQVLVASPPTSTREEAALWDVEAALVAERVDGLVRAGRRPGDIVVLLRAFTHVSEFESALRARGVPVYVVQGRGFFAREEFQDVKALLRLVLNPHDDPALFAVLRSPVVGLPDDAALMLRMDADAAGHRFLWEVIRGGDFEHTAPEYRDRLLRAAASLAGLRARLGSPGLATLVEDALVAFDYDLALLRSDDGLSRFANVRKLARLAAEYEALEGPDLGGFLRFLDESGRLRGDREAGASILSEDDDVVRVMTIHKAKGLEFPVVVVAGMGSAPSRGRETRSLEVSGGRVGLRVPGPSGKPEDRLILGPYVEMRDEAVRASAEEAARVYYVAATRAREHLMLVGAAKDGGLPADGAPLSAVLRSLGIDRPPGSLGDVGRPVASLDLTLEWAGGEVTGTEGSRTPCISPGSVTSPSPTRTVDAPAFPDTARTGPGIRQTSFSALRRYEECPRAYYLEYVLGLDEDRLGAAPRATSGVVDGIRPGPFDTHGAGGGAIGRAIGTAVHRVLEGVDLGARPDTREVFELLSASPRGEAPLAGAALEHAVRLSLALWDSPYVPVSRPGEVFRERPFRFAHDRVVVTGFMDLVIEGADGRWLVVDYKTNRLDESGPEAAFAPYDLQSRLYGLACLLGGAEEAEVAFVFLEAPTAPVSRLYHRGDIGALGSVLSSRLAGPMAGDFPRAGDGCDVCASSLICRSLGDRMV